MKIVEILNRMASVEGLGSIEKHGVKKIVASKLSISTQGLSNYIPHIEYLATIY